MKKLIYFILIALISAFPVQGFAQFDFLSEDPNITEENIAVSDESENPDIPANMENTADDTDISTEPSDTVTVANQNISQTPDENKSEYNILNPKPRDFIDEIIENTETTDKARRKTRQMLEQKAEELSLRASQKRLIQEGDKKREQLKQKADSIKKVMQEEFKLDIASGDANETTQEEAVQEEIIIQNTPETPLEENEEKQAAPETDLQPAPFGLLWNASQEKIAELGFELVPAARDNYKNVFMVKNSQQNTNTFTLITAIFGLQNRLWCIYAQSDFIDDTPQANKILDLYHTYYQALEKKYGNAKEFIQLYSYSQEIVEGEGDNKNITIVNKENPIGNDNFLQELQEGKAAIYATFSDDIIGITLGISINDKGQSYLSIDYKNLAAMQKEDEDNLNNLMKDI